MAKTNTNGPDAPLATRLGAAFRSARARLRLSREALAAKAGVHAATVRQVESRTARAEWVSYEKVAVGLGTTLDALLSDLLAVGHGRAQPLLYLRIPYPATDPVDLNAHVRQHLMAILKRLPAPPKPPR